MTKQQMIELIADKISEFQPDRKYISLRQAEHVLDAIEKAGMTPPKALIPLEPYEHPLIPGDFKNDKGEWCKVMYTWEYNEQ